MPAETIGERPASRASEAAPSPGSRSRSRSRSAGSCREAPARRGFAATVAAMGDDEDQPDNKKARAIDFGLPRWARADGRMTGCWRAAGMAGETRKATNAGSVAEDRQRADAVDPHHRRRRVANNAAGAAGVQCCNDRRDIADMDFPLKTCRAMVPPISAAAMLREKRQKDEDDAQGGQPPASRLPGRKAGISSGSRLVFEVTREDGEAGEKREKVRRRHPLILDVERKPDEAAAGKKAGGGELVDEDRQQTGKSDGEDVPVKPGDPNEGRAEGAKPGECRGR